MDLLNHFFYLHARAYWRLREVVGTVARKEASLRELFGDSDRVLACEAGTAPATLGAALYEAFDREEVERVCADTHLHVSLDVDFLDPDIAPGVGTTVRGGPTYREAQLCMEMIADTGLLASLDVVELNPALDVRNRTAELAVDLIESLFGKSTLMRSGQSFR